MFVFIRSMCPVSYNERENSKNREPKAMMCKMCLFLKAESRFHPAEKYSSNHNVLEKILLRSASRKKIIQIEIDRRSARKILAINLDEIEDLLSQKGRSLNGNIYHGQ